MKLVNNLFYVYLKVFRSITIKSHKKYEYIYLSIQIS